MINVIRLGDNRIVLKRGLRELLLEGAETVRLVEHVLPLLEGAPARDEIVEAFPGPWREQVGRLIDALAERGLLDDRTGAMDASGGGSQDAFYANFPLGSSEARKSITSAEVVVVGRNRTTHALTAALLASGVGRLTLVSHGGLDAAAGEDGTPPAAWTAFADGDGRLVLAGEDDLSAAVAGGAVTTAGCDVGEADALLDVNRAALAAQRPFLPFWISELVGYVGPLVYPFETACLRCYRLRIDSNDPHRAVNRPLRSAVAAATNGRLSPGLVAPMAGVVGDIAAMEVLKVLAPFAPSDVVARAIEINLVSFSSVVRRVLKVPRCPDCSEAMDAGAVTTRVGPQITQVGMWAG